MRKLLLDYLHGYWTWTEWLKTCWCACFVVHHPYSVVNPQPGRGDWQPTVTVRACCLCLPERLVSTASTATSHPMLVHGWHQNNGPGFHYQSPGQVQRTVIDELMRCLQSVQNAVARLITGTRRCGQHLTSSSPAALSQCGSTGIVSTTRSSLLFIGVTWLPLLTLEHWSSVVHSSFGNRIFAAVAPQLWNCLPSDIRHFILGSRATGQCDFW